MATPRNPNTCYDLQGNLFNPAQIDLVCAGNGEKQSDSDYGIPQGLNRADEIAHAYRTALAAWQNFRQMMARTDLSTEQKLQGTQHFARLFFQYGLGYNSPKQISAIEVADRIHPDEPLFYPVNFLLDQSTDALSSAQKLTETTVQSGTTQIVPLAGDGVHKASTILPLTIALADFDPKTKKRADLDTASPLYAVQGEGQRKKSPFQMTQQLLNADPRFLWAFAFNGYSVRLLRDSMTIARPSYLEFNLEEIFSGDHQADFTQMWLLLHASRANVAEDGLNVWERWVKAGYTAGQPAREKLSVSLCEALDVLGNGFLHTQGEGNAALCHKLATGELSAEDYNHQLLRLMYRFLFVFCLEEREIINTRMTRERAQQLATERNEAAQQAYKEALAQAQAQPNPNAISSPESTTDASLNDSYTEQAELSFDDILPPVEITAEDILQEHHTAQQRYQEGYSLQRLRYQALKQRFQNDFCDAWEGACIVFEALAQGQPDLALPALGGLFNHEQCVDLMAARLSNKDFFAAMRLMRWAYLNGSYTLIDYKNMDTEELGSLYEGMLELVPQIANYAGTLTFRLLDSSGNERKSTGSYYTPDFLVQSLIKTALDPVIAQKLKDNPLNPEQALLSLKVIDPACGSGHFLLAAARRIANELAQVRAQSLFQAPAPELYRHSLHEVISKCIYGVDVNPMAVELARMGLWLEGFAENEPLSFLDHHLQVGNSLLGVMDLKNLKLGIAPDAYKAASATYKGFGLSDKDVCAVLKKKNDQARKKLQESLYYTDLGNLSTLGYTPIEQMGTGSLADETAKAQQAKRNFELLQDSPEGQACDLILAAFLCEKSTQTQHLVPTSAEVGKALQDHENFVIDCVEQLAFARQVCAENKVFHWPLRFFDVFTQGGFDCVLGNPPWEKPQVEDRKWFAPYFPAIAFAQTAAIRKKMVEALSKGTFAHEYDQDLKDNSEEAESIYEQKIFANYVLDLHRASMATLFCHLSEKDGGRFPLTGFGSTNLYAYLAEIALQLKNKQGSVGMVMPIGIVTDDATKKFSQQVFSQAEVSSVYHFNNTENIFPAVDGRYSFALLTLHPAKQADCVFYATKEQHLQDERRHIYFAPNDMALMNPNTQTLPLVRTEFDLKLCRKLYLKAPILINQSVDTNPWPLSSLRGFDMSDDSRLFITYKDRAKYTDQHLEPLYEGKLIWQFDHRFASFKENNDIGKEPEAITVTNEDKELSSFKIHPRYWVASNNIQDKLIAKNWSKQWIILWRDIARSTDERTLVAAVLPSRYATGRTLQPILPNVSSQLAACLLATLNSLVVDYVQRIKQSGMHCNLLYVRQLPILPPEAFKEQDVAFICEHVAKLTRTADDINAVWLTDYPAYTFQGPEERLQIRCELDAYIARMYGLTRDELHYILDPADAMNDPTYPSVTFPSLKNKELKLYGEYRTKRLVLQAFDALEAGTLK